MTPTNGRGEQRRAGADTPAQREVMLPGPVAGVAVHGDSQRGVNPPQGVRLAVTGGGQGDGERSLLRHIHIESGALTLDFKASAEQASNVADELAHGMPEFRVTVDDVVDADLPPLPCSRLWE